MHVEEMAMNTKDEERESGGDEDAERRQTTKSLETPKEKTTKEGHRKENEEMGVT